jgi:toxin-antitoxin system PIN domain toxin
VIIVDANLLLYAVNRDFPDHERARHWWESTLVGDLPVRLPWVVILAFIRISTSPKVFTRPLPVAAAAEYIEQWLGLPAVEMIYPAPGHWQLLARLLNGTGTGGNLTTDAHLAALALQHGATVYSADNDFKRFPGLVHVNPLQA